MPHPQFPRSAACGGHHRTEGPSSGQRPGRAAGSGEELVLWPRPARPHTALCHTAQICLNGCCFLCLQRGILPAISVATPGGYTPIRWRHGPSARASARQGSGQARFTDRCDPKLWLARSENICSPRRLQVAGGGGPGRRSIDISTLHLSGPRWSSCSCGAQLRLTRGSWQLVLPLHDPAPDTGHNFLICV